MRTRYHNDQGTIKCHRHKDYFLHDAQHMKMDVERLFSRTGRSSLA